VIDRFTQALEGDVVAAEYAMLATLSRLYSRDESESLLLGSMSLNLCGLAPNDPRIRALAAVISDIVPRCVKVRISIRVRLRAGFSVNLNSINILIVCHLITLLSHYPDKSDISDTLIACSCRFYALSCHPLSAQHFLSFMHSFIILYTFIENKYNFIDLPSFYAMRPLLDPSRY
jgi:hypothetical protein